MFFPKDNVMQVDKDLDFTQNYIDLMRLHLGRKVTFDVLTTNEGSDIKIASLLFSPFIVNACSMV